MSIREQEALKETYDEAYKINNYKLNNTKKRDFLNSFLFYNL